MDEVSNVVTLELFWSFLMTGLTEKTKKCGRKFVYYGRILKSNLR